MKRKIVCLFGLVMLLASETLSVYASENSGVGNSDSISSDWEVCFTEAGKVEDNLGTGNGVNDRIGTMQPGDEVTVSVTLANENSNVTHWYMKNTITKSMEDAQATGGAYSYNLVYEDSAGNVLTLYSSESVGGDNNNGLKDVDSRIGEEYFYLGSIAGGQSGKVRLTVGLDGETQGNSYMEKVANLTMNFAVEPQPQGFGGGGGNNNVVRTVRREVVNNQVVFIDDEGVPLARNTNIVRTSDEMNLFPYVLVACVSGSTLLIFAILAFLRRKEEEGGAVG